MAKNTEQKHLKHQKDATAGKRIIRITHVLDKYSAIEVPTLMLTGPL